MPRQLSRFGLFLDFPKTAGMVTLRFPELSGAVSQRRECCALEPRTEGETGSLNGSDVGDHEGPQS